ncbi:MAG TPA: hypothetical protein VK447_21525, partial [Myxococcaceae bacterium]|nr:hypothetical protein [Myxococcaceae bacterium]
MSSFHRAPSSRVRFPLALTLAVVCAAAACRPAAPQAPEPELPAYAQRRDGLRPPLDTVGDIFLGQGGPGINTINQLDGRGVNAPDGIALDTSVSPPRVYLADSSNNRVLAWANAIDFANGAPADRVIGQVDAFRNTCATNSINSATLCTPRAVDVDDAGNLYVADTTNNRVLEYDSPFTTDLFADRVFGQNGSFLTNLCNLGGSASASTLCAPVGVAVDSAGNLYVTDQSNHRVLRYTTPLADQVADAVVGQPGMTQTTANGLDNRGLSNPTRLALDRSVVPNRLYVADTDNHRVLGWSDVATFTNGGPADLVIGQPNFGSTGCNAGGVSQNTLCFPRGLAVDADGSLFIADTNNNRVLAYDPPFATDTVADHVWGQAGFTTTTCNSGGLGPSSLCGPYGVALDSSGNLLVADSGNHRVLRYQGGHNGDATADVVFGQRDFVSTGCNNNSGRSAQSLCNPRGLAFDPAGNLYIADYGNHRVLEFDLALPDVIADRVFGQSNMGNGSCNAGATGNTSLCNPGSVAVDGASNVWIGDEGNSRVLGYATPLTTNFVADRWLGKSSLSSTSCAPSSSTCINGSSPAVAVDGSNHVYVADPAAHRVLQYNAPFVTGNDSAADRVLGQMDFFNTARNMVDGASLSSPTGVHVDRVASPNRLFVADASNHRVLAWSTVAVTNGQAADRVFGQGSPNAGLCNNGGLNAGSLCTPNDISTDAAGNVYISDSSNSRVLQYDTPLAAGGNTAADRVFGQTTAALNGCNTGGLSRLTLCNPRGVAVAPSGAVLVADYSNHRVLRYDTPLTSDVAADAVLGQGAFIFNGVNLLDGAGMSSPYGVAIDRSVTPNRLYVADTSNSRVLAWSDVTAFQTGSPADLVLGQPDLLTSGCNSQGVSAASLCTPVAVAVDSNGRVYVVDNDNHRVLLYNPPFTTDTVADAVIGQADFTSRSSNRGTNPGPNTLDDPSGVAVSPTFDLFVSDYDNNRVLAFVNPWADGNADFVFGQSGYTAANCNPNGVTANSLCGPYQLAVDTSVAGLRLYVADYGNHRVLAYDAPLTTDSMADFVIGQTGMDRNNCNAGLTGLCDPRGVTVDALGNVYVGDSSNDRILEFTSPRTTDASADRIYGQVSPSGTNCNQNGAVGASTLCGPRALAVDVVGNLYAADTSNHRVIVYLANNRPSATGLTLTPPAPRTNDDLLAGFNYQDVDNDPQSGSEVRWYKNGVEQPAYFGLRTLPASATGRGEQWYFTARPGDGIELGRRETSPNVTILNTAPSASLAAISPSQPKTGNALTASYEYSDADGDLAGGGEIHWFRNNVEQLDFLNQLTVPASATEKGQFWYFTVRPGDGTDLGATVTSPVVPIGNTPPVAVNVQILPASPSSTASLTVNYGFADADLDLEAGSEIRWYRNGVPQPGLNNATSVPPPLTLDDQWFYTLRPRDGVDFGVEVTSTTVVVGGSAPTVTNVRVLPALARTDDTLMVGYSYSDPDLQPERQSQIRWYKNGAQQGTYDNAPSVPASATRRGESWHFTIQPCDDTSTCGLTQTAPAAIIQNTAPTATTPAISPASPRSTEALTATYNYVDADQDSENGSEIKWFKNGIEQASLANLRTVPGSNVAR